MGVERTIHELPQRPSRTTTGNLRGCTPAFLPCLLRTGERRGSSMLYIKSITLHHASSLASLFTTSSLTLIRMVVLGLASPSRSTKCAVTRDGKPLPWRIPCGCADERSVSRPAGCAHLPDRGGHGSGAHLDDAGDVRAAIEVAHVARHAHVLVHQEVRVADHVLVLGIRALACVEAEGKMRGIPSSAPSAARGGGVRPLPAPARAPSRGSRPPCRRASSTPCCG